MAEYIEREALLSELYSKQNGNLDIMLEIARFPAADVVPVVHGRWVSCFEDWRKQIEGDKCSECGFEHYGTNIRNYNYCPNCGARMDGSGEDERMDQR